MKGEFETHLLNWRKEKKTNVLDNALMDVIAKQVENRPSSYAALLLGNAAHEE